MNNMIYRLKMKGPKTGPSAINVCYCLIASIMGDTYITHKDFTNPDINNIHALCHRLGELHPTEQIWVEEV